MMGPFCTKYLTCLGHIWKLEAIEGSTLGTWISDITTLVTNSPGVVTYLDCKWQAI
jgi:hypothetical protein